MFYSAINAAQFADDFGLEKLDHGMNEDVAMSGSMVREPLIEVQILSARGKSGDVQSESKGSYFE